MASVIRFDNWQNTDGTSIATTNASGDITFAGAVAGAGKILQVVSTTKTDTFTTSASSFTDITGLSVSITPSSATSKVLIIASVTGSGDPSTKTSFVRLVRDSTAIAVGDTAGSRTRAFASQYGTNLSTTVSTSIVHLDSPSTTSSTTYKIQGFAETTGTLYINRSENDIDNYEYVRGASSITVMEVSA